MDVALAVLAAVSCATTLVAWGAAVRALRRIDAIDRGVQTELSASRDAREQDPKWLRDVREELEDLRFQADRTLREARSREATATHAVRRAREELRESGAPSDERLETIADELFGDDEDGGEEGGVLPLRTHVGGAPPEAPGVSDPGAPPDWETLARRRKFGA